MANTGSFTDYTEDLVLNFLFTTEAAPRPTDWYVGLFTDGPGEDGSGTELPVADGYIRKSAVFEVSGTDPTEANTTDVVEFDEALGIWGLVTHIAIFDAETGGNMLGYAELEEAKQIGTGDVFRIPVGDLTITLD